MRYNFCTNINEKCHESETSFSGVYEGTCYKLAGSIDGENEGEDKKNINSITIEDKNNNTSFLLELAKGDKCKKDPTKNYKIKYLIHCNKELELKSEIKLDFSKFNPNECENTFEFEAKEACPIVNFYGVYLFFDKHYIWVGAIVIVIGIFLCFFGRRVEQATKLIVCALFVPLILIMIVYGFFTVDNSWAPYVILGVGLAAGIGLGILFIIFEKFFGAILGAGLGYIIAVAIYNTCLQYVKLNATLVYYLTIAGGIILFAILGYCLYKTLLVIGTAIIGGYLIVRGISLYAGGFPNESTVVDLLMKKEYEELVEFNTPIVYAYLGGFVLLAILGSWVQFKLFGKKEEKPEEESAYSKLKSSPR